MMTKEELEAAARVASFEHLLDIGLAVVKRYADSVSRDNGEHVVQICGPMSTGGLGSLDANMRRFQIAIQVLRETGVVVFDQTPFQEGMVNLTRHRQDKGYVMEILTVFYKGIFESGHLTAATFIPDWETSFGSRWEREMLSKLGLEISEYPPDLWEEVVKRYELSESV